MSFATKFGGTCAKCAGYIAAGQMVNYDGSAIRHAPRCPAKGTVTEVPAPAAARKDEPLTDATPVLGKASYKGKPGYLVLWHGTTKEGKRATKLAFRDGSKTFWGNGDVAIEKMYDEPISFGRLNRLAAEFKAKKAAPAAKPATLPDARLAEIAASFGAALVEPAHVASFAADGKVSLEPGEKVTWSRKGTRVYGIVVSVDAPYYMSRQDCEDAEDMDDFDRKPGWYTPYTAREITEPAADRAAREAKAAADAAAKAAEAAAKAAHEAKIRDMSAGMVRIAGTFATPGAQLSAWEKGSDYSRIFAATAQIDGTPALHLSYGGYDDWRTDTFVSPATRDLIFAARLAERVAKEGWTREQALEYYRAEHARYGDGVYGGEFAAWVVAREAR